MQSFAAVIGRPIVRYERRALRFMAKQAIDTLHEVSTRIRETANPTVVLTRKYLAGRKDALSLGQGIVFWKPPEMAIKKAVEKAIHEPSLSSYGPDEGFPELRQRLRDKIALENGLKDYDVMVTTGAQQAFLNCLLTLCDHGDGVVLFKPYYFNHAMAIQMTGSKAHLIEGRTDPWTAQPDLDWLESRFQQSHPPKLVVLVNPNNPTGVVMSKEDLERASEICERNGAWLVVDNAYEYFVADGQHHCVRGAHVLHIFSFSKSFGMMGWRVGYIAYPKFDGNPHLESQIIKIQDSVVICASQIGQQLALECLSLGKEWVFDQVRSLEPNRLAAMDALSPLGKSGHGIVGGSALYFWAKLPKGCEDDEAVVEWLIKKHGVCVIPGSSCGALGHIRISFANQRFEQCKEACSRLKKGLTDLVAQGGALLTQE